MSLKCKVCGFEHKFNILTHIEENHPELATEELNAVEAYIAKFDCEVEDIVKEKPKASESKPKESVVSTAKKTAIAETIAETTETIEINGVEMRKGLGGEYVPDINMAYHFPKMTTDVLLDLQEKKKILTTGHTGCGKSSLFEQLAARLDQGILRVNLNAQITIGDFVGMWTVKAGETQWVDGVLPKSMKEGHWLVLEEIDFAEPAILSLLNTVLESNGKLVLKEKGNEVIKPHPNFRILGTANTVGAMQAYRSLYQGTSIMNEAFLDRFRVYHVDYLPAEEESKVLQATLPKLNKRIADTIVRVANMVRESFKKEDISCTFSTRRVLDWSELMIRKKEPVAAAEIAIFSKISKEDADVIKGIIQRVMIGGKE